MGGADGNGQRVAAGAFDEFRDGGRIGVDVVRSGVAGEFAFAADGLRVADVAEFGFDADAAPVHQPGNLPHRRDVFIEGAAGGVEHHAGKARVGAAHAQSGRGRMIEHDRDRDSGAECGEPGGGAPVFDHRADEVGFDRGEDHRGILLLGDFNRRADHRGVGDVEHRHGVARPPRILQYFL